MRKLFLVCLVALVCSVGVVALVEREPGYVLVSYGDYTIESSLWIALALVVLGLLVAYILLRLLYLVLASPWTLTQWLKGRRYGRAAVVTQRGLVNFTEGHWGKARSLLLRGAENNEAPLVNYLAAAGASARLGESGKASEYLSAAESEGGEVGDAVALTRARLALDAGDQRGALDILEDVKQPGPAALDLQRRALLGLEDWSGLAGLLPELRKQGVLDEAAQREFELGVYAELLDSCVERGPTAAQNTLHQEWQRIPAELRKSPELTRVYCRSLIATRDHSEAESMILRTQRHGWDPQLARLYAYVESDDPARQLATAEDWRGDHRDEPELYLCLGRLAARNRLWGKAREYFEQSHRLQPGAEVCAELGLSLIHI